jgi:hypothetical protein
MYCPILAKSRPEKLVIHARRRDGQGDIVWPVHIGPLVLNCSIFTLVFDETDILAGKRDVFYTGLNCKIPEEIRLILTRKQDHYDDMDWGSVPATFMRDLLSLVDMTILPLLDRINVPLTVYFFRPVGPGQEHLASLRLILEDVLSARHLMFGGRDASKPVCTIRTLSDYIEGGCEDEFPPDELHYWREMYEERKNLEKAQTERE